VPRAEAPRTVLVFTAEGHDSREEDLSGRDQVFLGRLVEPPGVMLRGAHTSRTHAAVLFNAEGKAWIKDLGSSNGTFLDNEKLALGIIREWKPGNTVRFGLQPNHDDAVLQRRPPGRGAKRPREEEALARNQLLPKARFANSATEHAGAAAASTEAKNGKAQPSSQGPFIGPQPPPRGLPMQGPQLPPANQRSRTSLVASSGRGAEALTNGAGGKSQAAKCDKCDGPHATIACPHFKKPREEHKDAWANYGSKRPSHMGSDGGNVVLRNARTIKQPGDGSCLFHSLCYGLSRNGTGRFDPHSLRREIARFIEENPHLEISGDTLEEWIRWDANTSSTAYARRMAAGGWGGGIEMAACSRLKNVSVHVYEPLRTGGFRRISCFDHPQARGTVYVLYQGGVHYDALVPAR